MKQDYYEEYRQLGLNIAYYRKARGYTQLQLAEALDIDRSHMSGIEIATQGISLDLIFRLCKVLDITPAQLFDFRA